MDWSELISQFKWLKRVVSIACFLLCLTMMSLWIWTADIYNHSHPNPAIKTQLPGFQSELAGIDDGVLLGYRYFPFTKSKPLQMLRSIRLFQFGRSRYNSYYRADINILGFKLAISTRTYSARCYMVYPHAEFCLTLLVSDDGLWKRLVGDFNSGTLICTFLSFPESLQTSCGNKHMGFSGNNLGQFIYCMVCLHWFS